MADIMALNSLGFVGGCNYSTEEKVVGTWIDGKPIYSYTYVITSDVTISYNSWSNVFVYSGSIACVIRAELIRKTTTANENIYYPLACDIVPNTTTTILCQVSAASSVTCKPGSMITLYFTKTTD